MRMPTRSLTWAAVLAVLAVLFMAVPATITAKDNEGKAPTMDPFGQMTIDQVERRLGQPNIHVYDGNGDETYHNGHVPGAVRLLSKNITAEKLPADKDATLIFYCANLL